MNIILFYARLYKQNNTGFVNRLSLFFIQSKNPEGLVSCESAS